MHRERIMKGVRLTVFAMGTGVLMLLMGLSWWYAFDFMTPRYSTPAFTPDLFNLPHEDVTINTEDGIELTAWYIPPPEGSSKALIYLHGISSGRAHHLEMASLLYEDGYGGVLLDIRGHGGSDVKYRTMGVTEVLDVRAATEYLLAKPEVEQVGVYGSSFGASVALLAAAEIPEIEMVVALSPYSSLVDVVGDRAWQMYKLPPRPTADLVIWWMNGFTGENIYNANPKRAVSVVTDRPVLLVHGALDPVIPVVSAERITQAGGDNITYWEFPDVGHETDWYMTNYRYDEMLAFIDEAFG